MLRIFDHGSHEESCFLERLKTRNAGFDKTVEDVVCEILENVKNNGDGALLEYGVKYDGQDENTYCPAVGNDRIEQAFLKLDKGLREAVERAGANIRKYHEKQVVRSWMDTGFDKVTGQIIRPLERVGIYVPAGSAPLISSVLMIAIPAKVAGVGEIFMATPPGKDGRINEGILGAAKIAGVDRVFAVGGAQAIGAFAFGTQTIPRVDKIAGPGNIYVATAKRMVYGICDIDMLAGPSEIAVIADENASAPYIGSDLLSQAEHDPMAASVLITTSRDLARKVKGEVERQVISLSRKDIIGKSLENYGAIIVCKSMGECISLVNHIAPEHLELHVENGFLLLGEIKNAGAIFIGEYTPEACGDYYAGPSHVLPTGGTAKFSSVLSVDDFCKKTSIVSFGKSAFRDALDDIITLAMAEGLDGHANSAAIRKVENV